jgi:hypothetical protein
MIVMSSAAAFYLLRGELSSAIFSAVLLVLITVVAYIRSKVLPLKARRRA